ncbi:MAG: TatD family hydrolase [bacterium]
MFVDSHCHLNYLEDPDGAIARARERGVNECLCIGVDQPAIEEVLSIAADHEHIWASVGEHPGSCSGDAGWVTRYLQRPKVVALGEMGLDYHYVEDPAAQALQRDTFAQQLALAHEHDFPVIIHTRAAQADTLALIRDFPGVVGVLHCFTESWELASAAIELGYYVSISGIVTFKNAANVREVAVRIPAQRLLIETDAPYLAPVPNRGRKNEPAFVTDTAAFLADLRGVELQTLAEETRANFFRLFNRAQPFNSAG